MTNLKQKTISGLSWSFVGQFARYGIDFIIGIILARLLSPKQYGLIAMVTIFIAVSRSFVDSGFTQALIRKNDAKQIDYSTVFYFNIIVSLLLYILLYFLAKPISHFYGEPKLIIILKVLGLRLILDALSIIQRAKLTKRIDFKLQTKITVISSLLSGVIGIVLAYLGFGVWALVAKMLIMQIVFTILLWYWNRWIPTLEFSFHSFKEMFSFGYKLLLSGLIYTLYLNVYKLIIGKYFSAAELGFYSRAEQFRDLPSKNLTGIIQRVSYPVLANIQDDAEKLKKAYRRLIKSSMFISFTLIFGLAATAKAFILVLIGEKWMPVIVYLQLLCFAGMLYPLQAINLNMLKVQGRSDLFLKLEIIKIILAIPVIILGIFISIKAMIICMIFNSFIAFILNSYYSGKKISYSSFNQLRDIFPSFLTAFTLASIIFLIGELTDFSNPITLLVQIIAGLILFFIINETLKLQDYIYIKLTVLEKIRSIYGKRK